MSNNFYLTLSIGSIIAEPVSYDLIEALTKAQVTVSAGQRSGFQLTFTAAKSSRIQRQLLPSGYFDPPSRVILGVRIGGRTTIIMDGVITRHDLNVSNDPGQTTLTLTGVDVSQMMDLQDFSGFPWPAMPPEARVAIMIAKYAPYGMIPLVIPSPLLCVPNPLKNIPAQQGTDYAYTRSLASRTGYVFYVEPTSTPGVNLAYWGPEIKTGAVQPALTVNSDGWTNVESLSFSFDGISKTIFAILVRLTEVPVPIPIPIPDVTPLNPRLGQKVPIPLSLTFLNRFNEGDANIAASDVIEAAATGLARASEGADVISASGSLDVLRYGRVLQARSLVAVRGAGMTYDGNYFVKSVTHNIKRGEYKQSFTLSRNAQISQANQVPV